VCADTARAAQASLLLSLEVMSSSDRFRRKAEYKGATCKLAALAFSRCQNIWDANFSIRALKKLAMLSLYNIMRILYGKNSMARAQQAQTKYS
jgi:hypothetical protein